MHSFPDHANAERHCLTYPDFGQIEVDEDRSILRLVDQIDELHSLYLLAPSKEILNSCIAKMERIMERRAALPPLPTEATDPERDLMSEFSVGAEESLVEYPTGSTTLAKVVFVALFPFRILIHWTVPDVRVSDSHNIPMGKLSTAFLAVVSCLCWLIVGSYTMVLSLEALAKLLHTSQSFVGISIAAAGTSVPNYIASRIAAERGFGVSSQHANVLKMTFHTTRHDRLVSPIQYSSISPEHGSLACFR